MRSNMCCSASSTFPRRRDRAALGPKPPGAKGECSVTPRPIDSHLTRDLLERLGLGARALPLAAGLLLGSVPAMAQPVPVGPDFQVNTYSTGNQALPGAAMDAAGNFLVVWDSVGQDGHDRGVFARLFDSTGAPRGSEFQVNTYTTGPQYGATAAMDPDGDFVVVWNSMGQDGSFRGLFAQIFDSAGDPVGGEFLVNTYTPYFQYFQDAAMAPDGSFVVTWNSTHDGSDYGIFARRFDSGGIPIDAEEFRVNTHTAGAQNFPKVGMNGSGGFLIAWESEGQDGDQDGVFARRYDMLAGPTDAEEFQVNTYTTGRQRVPGAAMQENGDFVVVWSAEGQDGNDYGIVARRFDSTASPLDPTEFVVNTYTTGLQHAPSVIVDRSGAFIVSWEGGGVFSRSFEADGTPLDTSQFTISGNGALFHEVAGGRATGFVAAWTDLTSRDGGGSGVFARLGTCDLNGSGLCDREAVRVTIPGSKAVLGCSDPRFDRPTFGWSAGNYDKFRVLLASDPAFVKGTRVTSGDTLLKTTTWTPSGKKWRNACRKALAANPSSPVLFIKVFGVDVNLPKSDPHRKTLSQVVAAGVQP